MTKFASADDPGFLAVVGQLHLWVKELRLDQPTLITTASDIVSSPTCMFRYHHFLSRADLPGPALTASEKRYVTSFGPPTFIDIDDQIVGTCTWTTETAQYKRWNEDNGSAILWLTGNAGCGKTVLTNFLVQSICQQQTRQTSNSSAVICSFFCTRDREVLHDVRSLLRNLIRQILTNAKEVIHHIKALFGSTTNEYDPSFETLWRIFEEAIRRVPCQNVYLVIDALDECDEKWRSRFLLRLTRTMIELRGDGLTSRKIVRVVLSGQPQIRRPGAPIAGLNQYHLDLDQKPDGMIQDIRRFIGYKVKELVDDSICSESTGTTLRLTLESMSENSFLWLRMVVEHIRNSLRYHDTDVKQMLNEVPHDLQKAFAAYLPILPSSEIPLLRKYLYLIVGCARPLTVAEVDSFSNVGSKTFSSSENNVVMNSIRRALGPLIKFPNNTVQLVHSTAKEFFILLRSQPEHRCYASHGVDPKAADLFCAVRCMEYIAGEAVTKFFVQCVAGQESYDSSPISPRSTQAEGNEDGMLADLFDIEDVTFLKDQDVHHAEIFTQARQKLEAYDYAVRNWTSHFARSEQLADEAVLEKAVELLSCSSDPVSNWYQYLAHFSRLDMPNSGECDAIVLAALFNHTRSLRVLLSRNRYTLDSIQLQRAMFWAASRGNCASVVVLLDYGVQFSKAVHLAPLPVAIRGEHVDVCQMLLDSGNVDLNRADDEGKPPLVLAATLNHSTILGLLLQQPTVQVNLPDRWGRNALMVACASQSEECISALLKDSRSHHNDQAYNGYSPIHYAAQHGCDHAIKSLLTLQDLKIGTLTATGRSALSLAAQNGHLSIVRRLCHKGLSAAAKDTHGRNAISWATNSVDATSSNGAECVLQYLVRKFPDAADAADNNGWTPLAWAMDPPGYRRSVEILLRSGHVNINHRDRTYGRSILAWAASQGLVEILKDILKMDGVKKNSLSFDGRTPLSHAASNGMLEVVEVLVNDAEVSKHLPDASGRRPVDWARLNGHASIAALLKESAPCE